MFSSKLVIKVDKTRLFVQLIIGIVYAVFIGIVHNQLAGSIYSKSATLVLSYLLLFIPIIILFPLYNEILTSLFSCVLFAFFCGLRIPNSIDDWNYSEIFRQVSLSWKNVIIRPEEKGYLLLCKIVSLFTQDYQIASIVIISISIILFAISVQYMNCEVNVYFLLAHYFFFLLFRYTVVGLIRIQLATPFFLLLVYEILIKKDYRKSLIFYILGAAFHLSFLITGFVYLPLLARKLTKNEKDYDIVNNILLLAVFAGIPVAISILLRVLPVVKYGGYVKIFEFQPSAFSVALIVLIIYFTINKKMIIADMDSDRLAYSTLMSCLIGGTYLQLFYSTTAIGRVSYYLMFSIPLLLGYIKTNINFFYNKYFAFVAYTIIGILYFFVTQGTNEYILKTANTYQNLLNIIR